ncbi:putative helicase MOV-10, partial [Kipferlia bialata]
IKETIRIVLALMSGEGESDGEGLSQKEIAIVTPYRLQGNIIRNTLRDKGLGDILVGSVEAMQGQEFDAVVVSCVRTYRGPQYDTRGNLGFLADDRRLNVMLTRPRKFIAIVGDPNALSLCDSWRGTLRYIDVNGGAQGYGLECLRGGKRIVAERPKPQKRSAKVTQRKAERERDSEPEWESSETEEVQTKTRRHRSFETVHVPKSGYRNTSHRVEAERDERPCLNDINAPRRTVSPPPLTPVSTVTKTNKKTGSAKRGSTGRPTTKRAPTRYIPGSEPAPAFQPCTVQRQPITQASRAMQAKGPASNGGWIVTK